jgi:hypothetical protein
MPDEQFTLSRIDRIRYRPTRSAQEILDFFRSSLMPGEKWRVAQLAIARSIAEAIEVRPLGRDVERATSAIEGTHLFGDDLAAWAALICAGESTPVETVEQFRDLVEAHWDRGSTLLQSDLESVDNRQVDFALHLASLAGLQEGRQGEARGSGDGGVTTGTVSVRLGEVSLEQRTNQVVEVKLNAQGVSPHLALMGKTRSGKTRTGIVIAEQLAAHKLPFLFIDPKGEFVREGRFIEKSEWRNRTFGDRFSGAMPLSVPSNPVPLDFLAVPPDAGSAVLAQMAMAFRDSFQKCINTRGAIQLDTLRQVVNELLSARVTADGNYPISLEQIRDAVSQANQAAGKTRDTIEAKLNELTALRLFEPRMSPAEFFSHRWVIDLAGAPEEAKRLVMFLLLDALSTYLLSLPDSDVDEEGNRACRMLLLIDEAKEILAFKHGALSNLIRKSAAKGGIVMLLSQSPEDFDQEADDFLSQMGSILVFASVARSVKNLRAALGKKLNPEELGDKALGRGIALAKLPGMDPIKIIAWR